MDKNLPQSSLIAKPKKKFFVQSSFIHFLQILKLNYFSIPWMRSIPIAPQMTSLTHYQLVRSFSHVFVTDFFCVLFKMREREWDEGWNYIFIFLIYICRAVYVFHYADDDECLNNSCRVVFMPPFVVSKYIIFLPSTYLLLFITSLANFHFGSVYLPKKYQQRQLNVICIIFPIQLNEAPFQYWYSVTSERPMPRMSLISCSVQYFWKPAQCGCFSFHSFSFEAHSFSTRTDN